MQIRIANRQDEKRIFALITEIGHESGTKLDLETADKDLKNVEASYFGQAGLFLVAEADSKIIALAGANRVDETICALRRICVSKDWRRQGIGHQMMAIIIENARMLDYRKLIVPPLTDAGGQAGGDDFHIGLAAFYKTCGFAPQRSGTSLLSEPMEYSLVQHAR
jgi:N-acetylglutamate synthase-like GNAT family acetyltransferase